MIGAYWPETHDHDNSPLTVREWTGDQETPLGVAGTWYR